MGNNRVDRWMRENGYILIAVQDDFSIKHNRDKVYFQDLDGYKYCSRFHHLTRGIPPQKFYTSNPYTIDNIKLWTAESHKDFELVSTKYVKATIPLEWACKKCNKVFSLAWNHIKKGEGCRHCKYKAFGELRARPTKSSQTLLSLYPEICKEWDYTLNMRLPNEYKPYSEQSVWWNCNFCNTPYKMSIAHRTKDGCSCPKCKMSHGEKKIYDYLSRHSIDFSWQHKFEDCRNKRKLPFDFYLPQHNLCIEFQGEQHYSPYDFKTFSFTSKKAHENYEKIKLTDAIKRKYCDDHNINLLEIRYDQIRIVDSVLDEYLNELAS